jgi:hypothetical protein
LLLILTNKLDNHADHLIRRVGNRFPVLRLNTDNFLEEYDFSLGITAEGQLAGYIRDHHGRSFDFSQPAVGWYRKPDFELMEVRARGEFAGLVRSETASFMDAVCALPSIHWINDPVADLAARSEPAQLLMARELGFEVPETMITNEPDAALTFAQSADQNVVVKSVYSASVAFDGHEFATITKRIDRDKLTPIKDSVQLCPTQFQHEIVKESDVRVTVVASKVYACRIESQSNESTQIDWRVDPDRCTYSVLELPEWAERACRELVLRSGLEYGAIDLIRSRDGRYYFLENNPGGQYLWIELDTGLPITDALIDLFEARMGQSAP